MIDNIHDQEYLNDSEVRQYDDYLDISSQNYENFKPIDEFHNSYEEFPTVYYENVIRKPEEEEKRIRSDSSSSGSSSEASSGPGASAAASSSVIADLSAAQVLSATFVALVAVSAIVIPIIDNTDLDVDLDVSYSAGILTYMIELTNASDDTEYYAVVMEDQSIISQKQILDNFQSDTLTGLKENSEHRVEVRSGTPPLYVVKSEVIPASPSLVKWDHLTVKDNSVDYGVTVGSSDANVTIALYDPSTFSAVYSIVLNPGYNSDVIKDLMFSHTYEITVASENETYLSSSVTTDAEPAPVEPITVTGDLTPSKNSINYSLTVSGEGVNATLNVSEPTGAPVRTATLTSGTNTGSIENLEYSHTYLVTVTSDSETYLTERVTTEAEPVTVSLGYLRPSGNTIGYQLTVSGQGEVTMNVTGDGAMQQIALTSGTNTGTITGLQYSQTYLVTVTSGSETYLTESVTTDAEPAAVEPTTVEGDLTPSGNTINYRLTVSGQGTTVTLDVIGSTSMSPLYTTSLVPGTNIGVIPDLQYSQTYRVTVYSDTETYIDRRVTTEAEPTTVEPMTVSLGYLRPSGNTIVYQLTVSGEGTATLNYGVVGASAMQSITLISGTNTGTITGLQYSQTYNVTVTSSSETYLTESVTTEAEPLSVSTAYVRSNGNTIEYQFTVSGEGTATLNVTGPDGATQQITLASGTNTDTITGLQYSQTYLVTVTSGSETYYTERVTTGDQSLVGSVNIFRSGDDNAIHYEITMNTSESQTASVEIYWPESEAAGEILIDSERLISGYNSGYFVPSTSTTSTLPSGTYVVKIIVDRIVEYNESMAL